MRPVYEHTGYYRHAQKRIYLDRLLSDGSDFSQWVLRGGYALDKADAADRRLMRTKVSPYSMAREVPPATPDAERYGSLEQASRDGRNVIRMCSRTSTDTPNPYEPGRDWSSIIAKREFPKEDWRAYNRISVEIYADFPGFYNVSIGLILYNEGEEKLPNDRERDGIHFANIKNHGWSTIYWEIPDLGRDCVTALGFQYRMKGGEPGSGSTVTYDFTNLRIQKVDPDPSYGWEMPEKELVFSHVGYGLTAPKSAVSRGLASDRFQLIRSEDGQIVFDSEVRTEAGSLGTFQILDFTSVHQPGRYFIKCKDTISRPFSIGKDIWKSTLEKVANFYYGMRCGYAIPGIHGVCHADLRCTHNGVSIAVNGGWHDAGDLSQGCCQTADSVYGLLLAAEKCQEADRSLYEELSDEAHWGMDWLLKTRFGDGYRPDWVTVGNWTDGIVGTLDDISTEAMRVITSNFTCSRAESLASRFWKEDDPVYAERCLKAAAEDYGFALEDLEAGVVTPRTKPRAANLALGILAGLELYQATNEMKYLDQSASLSTLLMECQAREIPDWDIPLRGYFYTDESHRHILQWNHLSFDQAPGAALARLYRQCPDHPLAATWKNSLELYAEYLKQSASYTEPYGIFCAAVYDYEDPPAICPEDHAHRQMREGIRLSDRYWLRRFPVWFTQRGNTTTELATAIAAAETALALGDRELLELTNKSLEWQAGHNPFNRCLIWGEGYNFNTVYSPTSGDIVGGIPVGVRTLHDEDIPYYPTSNYCNWNEVWVHGSAKWLWLVSLLWNM